jgi:hypothetical protein
MEASRDTMDISQQLARLDQLIRLLLVGVE